MAPNVAPRNADYAASWRGPCGLPCNFPQGRAVSLARRRDGLNPNASRRRSETVATLRPGDGYIPEDVKAIKSGGFSRFLSAPSCCRKAGQAERIGGNTVRGKGRPGRA